MLEVDITPEEILEIAEQVDASPKKRGTLPETYIRSNFPADEKTSRAQEETMRAQDETKMVKLRLKAKLVARFDGEVRKHKVEMARKDVEGSLLREQAYVQAYGFSRDSARRGRDGGRHGSASGSP